MKKSVIISTQPIGEVNHSAFVRNSKFVKENIPGTFLIDCSQYDKFHEKVDNIIVAYGAFYADFQALTRLLDRYKDKRFFYLVNEYGLLPNGDVYRYLIKHNYEILANYTEDCKGAAHYHKFHIINFNVSAFRDLPKLIPFEKRPNDLIYWGRFRPDRVDYFKKYLHNCTVSSAKKNQINFEQLGQNIKITDVVNFDTNSILNQFKFSIYIEDFYTHEHFNHLADRFYESVDFGLIPLFDINTKRSVQLSGYKVPEYYFVKDKEELQKKIKEISSSPEKHLKFLNELAEQIKNEKAKVLDKVSTILNSDPTEKTKKCNTCGSMNYEIINCKGCNKEICKSCMIMRHGFWCEDCGKEKVPENLQTTLF